MKSLSKQSLETLLNEFRTIFVAAHQFTDLDLEEGTNQFVDMNGMGRA